MTDTPAIAKMTTTTPDGTTMTSVAPPKPGYQTTEFWLSLAAKLLGAAFASGLIGDGTAAARIAGLAAVVLSSMGYTVARGLVKASAAALAIALLWCPLTGCTAAERSAAATAAGHALVNCTGQAIGATPGLDVATLVAIANTVASERAKCTAPGAALSWACVEADLIGDGETLGGCTFVKLLAGGAASVPTTAVRLEAPTPGPAPGRVEFEDFRGKVAGGAKYHTSAGDY